MIAWLVFAASLAGWLLHAPVEFDALPQDRHLPFAAQGCVLAVAGDVGVGAGRQRLDQDPVQHGADGGAPAVGAP